MMNNKKIGLALGSGASRGLAHIGVLQVLEEAGITIDYIAGSSIGALVGALYSCGIKPSMMEGIAKNLDLRAYYDVRVPRMGFIQGKKIESLIGILTRNRDFSELEIPLTVTAIDLLSCSRVLLNKGKVSKAVRASISVPGIFYPVFENDQVLVDGGLLERIPANVARDMGADIVIGVDVGFRGQHKKTGNIFEVIIQSLEVMELELIKNCIREEDILIIPDVVHINPMQFDQVDECVKAGREATLFAIDKIFEVINK